MLLALDLGTTNVKALLTGLDGRAVACGSRAIHLHRRADGAVEQDLEEIWGAAVGAIQEATQGSRSAEVKAIGVSSQGGAMQVWDAAGQPLGRVISWLDQRGRPFDEALRAELGTEWFVERIAHRGPWLAVGQLLRLRHEGGAPARIGFVGDIIVSRLCGRAAQDGTSAALTLLYNPNLRTYDPDLLRRLDLAPSQLPALAGPREPAGGLLPEPAAALGLLAGTPVSAAVHDQYASALGTGALRHGAVMLGTGTAWVLLAVTDRRPAPVVDSAFVCHHLTDGLWGQILSMVNGGSALTWALGLTGLTGADAKRIDQLLASAPPGSDGLVFWPFMTPFGPSRLPPGTKGRLEGLQLSHGAAHLVRAVVEGLAYELKRHLGFLAETGCRVEQLVVGGGAAASPITVQLLADVARLPLRCVQTGDSSLLGAAVLARGLLEPEAPLASLAEAMAPPAVRVEPGPEAALYQERYQQYARSLPSASAHQS
jgi:sugar (pentulose or hexulose) kinase